MNTIQLALVISACSLLCLGSGVSAQSGAGSYRLEPTLVAGGGGSASGGGFTLQGSFGQAASATLDAAGYRLVGGFWAANPSDAGDVIFKNGFEDDPSP